MEPTAAQNEATGDSEATVTFEGVDLTFPSDPNQWTLDAVEAYENGKAIGLARALFGSGKYDQIKANFQRRTGGPMTLGDFAGILELVAKEAGFDNAGE